ncbi:phytyl ester synthase 1, chloroplastic-like isoform X2 [Pyrus x bretschneideri]|uniref:phytyl ester synthase 1, chloroplastic-like isoform X2 n=1 Tax=Pyrus x bretschneideri TaxID=225117 RepID=UPI00202EE14C|nr:phytyl ester synthase 1, chloroplastic-like isoform X2 [Pyrus x bretschneideri]
MVRGAAHPQLFWGKHASSPIFDAIKLLGAVPVTAKNLFKLFAAKSHVLLYPGSEREAVHNKGEEYKLFWLTDRNSREWLQVLGPQLYHLRPWEMMIYFKNDLMKIPMLSHHLKDSSRGTVRTRRCCVGCFVCPFFLWIPAAVIRSLLGFW